MNRISMIVKMTVPARYRTCSLTIPYKGGYEEDEGFWWIEFLPQK